MNISKEKLTTEEEDFLKFGLNFAPTPRNIPYIEFVAGIESAMHKAKISKDMSKELTSRICLAINKSQKPECNMLTSQCKALKSLKERKNIVILKADKGNATVIMDKEEYNKKCLSMLQPPTYLELSKDPTMKIERKVTEVLINMKKEKLITSSMFDRLRPKGGKAPRFYGLPKVHKEDCPLRPIVSAISSPSYNLSKFVSKMISPLVG